MCWGSNSDNRATVPSDASVSRAGEMCGVDTAGGDVFVESISGCSNALLPGRGPGMCQTDMTEDCAFGAPLSLQIHGGGVREYA